MADTTGTRADDGWKLATLLRSRYRHVFCGPGGSCLSGPLPERRLAFVVDLDSCGDLVDEPEYQYLVDHPQIEVTRYAADGPPAETVVLLENGLLCAEASPGWLLVTPLKPAPHRGAEPHWRVVRAKGDGWLQGSFDLGLVTVEWPRSRQPADIARAMPILATDQGGLRILVSTNTTADSDLLAHRKGVAVVAPAQIELLANLFRRRLGIFADEPGAAPESEATYFVNAARAAMTQTGKRWGLMSGPFGDRGVFDIETTRLLTTIMRRCSWTLHERDLLFAELLSEHESTADHQELRRFEALMIQLHALLDCSARLAHARHLPADTSFNAAWNRARWRTDLLTAAPELAGVVDEPSELLPVLDLVRALRNPLHGEGLSRFYANRADRPHDLPDRLVHIPADDKVSGEIEAALAALSPPESVQLERFDEGWLGEMGPLTEWVVPTVFRAVDALIGQLVEIPDPLPDGMYYLDADNPHRLRFEWGQRLRLRSLGLTATAE